ncbi:lantibiotic dehydratase C-terminal domain-containing protein [Nonomuraea fuscirosea]|uniref:lantibiotic dehydratase C-terminal domain-containing protein n=1 Tax=Nonomuraea fuscirosea TaxID=1291556 RepID=UPI0037B0C9D6
MTTGLSAGRGGRDESGKRVLPVAGARSWISAHIFYDGDLDLVITDLLDTVHSRLDHAAAGQGLFFLRYWEGGPHLRVRVLAGPGRADDVRRILSGAVADSLNRLPAPVRVTQEDYDSYAPSMAALERLRSYERHRRPPNSFAFIPPAPRRAIGAATGPAWSSARSWPDGRRPGSPPATCRCPGRGRRRAGSCSGSRSGGGPRGSPAGASSVPVQNRRAWTSA